MSKKVIVIGSGFAGISCATYLAKYGYEVTVLEKNESAGGRCSSYSEQGYTFDMGPSWYWMPDVFEKYFGHFNKKPADYYTLERLDPSYRIFFDKNDQMDIPAKLSELAELFESLEKGSAKKLNEFLESAAYKYKKGMDEFVHKPSLSIAEFTDISLVPIALKLQLHTSVASHVSSLFKNEKIKKILEFPVYFLGALPKDTPALYTLMNYADLALGTWYPQGGMYKIIEGMVDLAQELGVKFIYNEEVEHIDIDANQAHTIRTKNNAYTCDIVVAGADYHHIEQKIIEKEYRQYDEPYWDKRVMAPSSLIYYLGVNKKIDKLLHHNLFFDKSFEKFGDEIYTNPKWPEEPLFYVCCPSKSDNTVAPEGKENLFILIPVAPNLEDTEIHREHYYNQVMKRLEEHCGESIIEHVEYSKSFAHKDFMSRYHAYKGNAYGLANTLSQTAIFKPSIKNKKIKNLYFTGQLTVPGPGVPPSLISGEIVAQLIKKEIKL
ncbi:MAG: phytoene desaturase family protein [Bacteroidota bacterium]